MGAMTNPCSGAGQIAVPSPDGVWRDCPVCGLHVNPYPNGTVRRHNVLRPSPMRRPMTCDEFTALVRAVGPPPFRIHEAHWAAEATILPYLVFLCALGQHIASVERAGRENTP
jgi:hypothetical protein